MDLKAFGSAITQIVEEKGIPAERVLETIELALAAAYKRDYASRGESIRVKLEPKSGKMQVYKVFLVVDESMIRPEEEASEEGAESEEGGEVIAKKTMIKAGTPSPKTLSFDEAGAGKLADARSRDSVSAEAGSEKGNPPSPKAMADARFGSSPAFVGEAESAEDDRVRFNPERHMFVADAKKIQKGIKAGEELLTELEPHEEFGRIAAQTAKQVIVQRLREVERETIAQEYAEKAGEIISGIVQRVEGRTIYVDLGRGIGILFPHEQIPGEYLRIGSRVRALLLEVNMTPRGPQIILSRAHPDLVKQLFALEVPEVATGTVEVKAVAREAGSRTKIAVASNQQGVDPIGAMVGQRGTRVLTVINEVNGEKIDVIEWSEDTEKFISNALAPAKVSSVELRERTTATVKVPEDQMSLAIGREGQNVRLAVKLTNWKIDIEGAEEFLAEEGEGSAVEGTEAEDGERASAVVAEEVSETDVAKASVEEAASGAGSDIREPQETQGEEGAAPENAQEPSASSPKPRQKRSASPRKRSTAASLKKESGGKDAKSAQAS